MPRLPKIVVKFNSIVIRKILPPPIWAVPLIGLVAFLALQLLEPLQRLLGSVPRSLLMVAAALFFLWAWQCVAFGPLPRRWMLNSSRFKAMAFGATAGFLWSSVWLLIPVWGLLKLVGLLTIAPVMGWRWQRSGRPVAAWGVWVGWILGLGLVCLAMFANPWRLERFFHSLGVGELDTKGWHYQWDRLMDALSGLSPMGGGWSGVPPVLTRGDDAAWLLRLGANLGWIPMGLMAIGLVLIWLFFAASLYRNPVGERFSLRSRRLATLLALLHALAAALYGAWSFGYLYRPMGALPPLAHAGWWVLSVALAALWWRARQQRRIRYGNAIGVNPVLLWAWITTCLTWVGLSIAGLVHFPTHIQKWKQWHSSGLDLPAARVEMVDHSGEHLLAKNVVTYDLRLRPSAFWAASWGNPKPEGENKSELSDADREAALLGALSPWPQAVGVARYRLAQMERSTEGPKLLLWAQPKEVVDAVLARLNALGISGVEANARTSRYYPEGALTAHAVGFSSLSDPSHGQEGLELDPELRYVKLGTEVRAPLRTAINLRFQRIADGALKAAMKTYGASTGAVMIVDVSSGGVRAMVSAPGFDPNDPSSFRNPYQPERVLNQATSRPVALGSLLTPLLVADLLQRGILKTDSVVNLGEPLGLKIAGVRVKDTQPVPQTSLAEIVARSSNVGQAKLALRFTEPELQAMLEGSGLQGPTGMIGLSGAELAKPDWAAWHAGLQVAAGQNLTSTLARTVQAYLPIANGGLDRRLTLMGENEQGSTLYAPSVRRVLGDPVACEVRRMLYMATGAGGTAPLAQVHGVSVAGKTASTTHLPVWEGGILRLIAQADTSFIGMFPAENPQYLIGVRLGFSDTKPHLAGQTVAPVFAQVVQGMLASGALQQTAAGTACKMPSLAPSNEVTVR
jgi:cell division protein FtsI (penicillin-binding protein 3)